MTTAKESLNRIDQQIDWKILVERAMDDPPNPYELAEWLNTFGNDFSIVYGGRPTLWDYPKQVQLFFENLTRLNSTGRPCSNERHLAKVRDAWNHAVFRIGYEQNLQLAQIYKDVGMPYNGRIISNETPSEAVIGDIVKKTPFGAERLRKLLRNRPKK